MVISLVSQIAIASSRIYHFPGSQSSYSGDGQRVRLQVRKFLTLNPFQNFPIHYLLGFFKITIRVEAVKGV
jgi:hypothetical protein